VTRPHEDLERHQPTDHRPGGVPIEFAPGAWCAIDVAHVEANRVNAVISAYETLIEKARTTSTQARQSAVLRAANDRRVITIIDLAGHRAFHHLQVAWDEHHLAYGRHNVAASSTLALYRLLASADGALDPASHDVYAFEQLRREVDRWPAIMGAVKTAPGFVGALVFGADADNALALVYRFMNKEALEQFRESTAVVGVLGPVDGESILAVHPVRTFG
jgi:hypothetical protein